MKLRCKLFGHQRSRHRARLDQSTQQWKSVCRHCETPMVRIGPSDWHAVD